MFKVGILNENEKEKSFNFNLKCDGSLWIFPIQVKVSVNLRFK